MVSGLVPSAVKPRMRGVSHQWAFFVSVGTGVALVLAAPAGRATVARDHLRGERGRAVRGQRPVSPCGVGIGRREHTLGAIVYARQRPDPVPAVFGYHEIFHALVILAAAVQYAVVAFWVLPGGG